MSRGGRVVLTTLATVLAGSLLGGGRQTAVAFLTDTEIDPATFSTGCFTADTTPPLVSTTVISKTPQYLSGYIRQGATYLIYANVTDAECGISTVRANVATITTGQTAVPLVAGSYAVGGVSYNYRSASRTANATLAEGPVAYTITSTDNASNSQTQSGYSVVVDNTRPTATDVQTGNGGTIPGKAELGDTLILTFAEIIDPQSVLAGWTGAATNVVLRITNNATGDRVTIRNAANTAQLPLGTVNLIGLTYVPATRDFGAAGTASTMVQTGATITITMGTPSGVTGTEVAPGTMTETPVTTATDRAGNTCQTTVANESGAADVEF